MYWPAQLSIVGYLMAIGTIDNGGTGDFHTTGAVFFFIILFLIVVLLSLATYKMRQWDTSFMNRRSYLIKMMLAVYLLIVWIYCLIGLIFEAFSNDDDMYIVIVEWNSVYASLIWVLSFVADFKNVYLGLDGYRGISFFEERN